MQSRVGGSFSAMSCQVVWQQRELNTDLLSSVIRSCPDRCSLTDKELWGWRASFFSLTFGESFVLLTDINTQMSITSNLIPFKLWSFRIYLDLRRGEEKFRQFFQVYTNQYWLHYCIFYIFFPVSSTFYRFKLPFELKPSHLHICLCKYETYCMTYNKVYLIYPSIYIYSYTLKLILIIMCRSTNMKHNACPSLSIS